MDSSDLELKQKSGNVSENTPMPRAELSPYTLIRESKSLKVPKSDSYNVENPYGLYRTHDPKVTVPDRFRLVGEGKRASSIPLASNKDEDLVDLNPYRLAKVGVPEPKNNKGPYDPLAPLPVRSPETPPHPTGMTQKEFDKKLTEKLQEKEAGFNKILSEKLKEQQGESTKKIEKIELQLQKERVLHEGTDARLKAVQDDHEKSMELQRQTLEAGIKTATEGFEQRLDQLQKQLDEKEKERHNLQKTAEDLDEKLHKIRSESDDERRKIDRDHRKEMSDVQEGHRVALAAMMTKIAHDNSEQTQTLSEQNQQIAGLTNQLGLLNQQLIDLKRQPEQIPAAVNVAPGLTEEQMRQIIDQKIQSLVQQTGNGSSGAAISPDQLERLKQDLADSIVAKMNNEGVYDGAQPEALPELIQPEIDKIEHLGINGNNAVFSAEDVEEILDKKMTPALAEMKNGHAGNGDGSVQVNVEELAQSAAEKAAEKATAPLNKKLNQQSRELREIHKLLKQTEGNGNHARKLSPENQQKLTELQDMLDPEKGLLAPEQIEAVEEKMKTAKGKERSDLGKVKEAYPLAWAFMEQNTRPDPEEIQKARQEARQKMVDSFTRRINKLEGEVKLNGERVEEVKEAIADEKSELDLNERSNPEYDLVEASEKKQDLFTVDEPVPAEESTGLPKLVETLAQNDELTPGKLELEETNSDKYTLMPQEGAVPNNGEPSIYPEQSADSTAEADTETVEESSEETSQSRPRRSDIWNS